MKDGLEWYEWTVFLLVWNGSHVPLQRALHTTVNVDCGMSDGFPNICNTAVNVDCCISEGLPSRSNCHQFAAHRSHPYCRMSSIVTEHMEHIRQPRFIPPSTLTVASTACSSHIPNSQLYMQQYSTIVLIASVASLKQS